VEKEPPLKAALRLYEAGGEVFYPIRGNTITTPAGKCPVAFHGDLGPPHNRVALPCRPLPVDTQAGAASGRLL
jgi:hypothetical protein